MKFKVDDRVIFVNRIGGVKSLGPGTVTSVRESPDGPLYFVRWDTDAPEDPSFCYQDSQLKPVEPLYARVADAMRREFEKFSKFPVPDYVLYGMFTEATALVTEEQKQESFRNRAVEDALNRALDMTFENHPEEVQHMLDCDGDHAGDRHHEGCWVTVVSDEPERSVRRTVRPVLADDMIDLVNIPTANVMISEHARHLWVCTPDGTVLRIKADKITLDDRRISKDD